MWTRKNHYLSPCSLLHGAQCLTRIQNKGRWAHFNVKLHFFVPPQLNFNLSIVLQKVKKQSEEMVAFEVAPDMLETEQVEGEMEETVLYQCPIVECDKLFTTEEVNTCYLFLLIIISRGTVYFHKISYKFGCKLIPEIKTTFGSK